jgi:hypothetical protein
MEKMLVDPFMEDLAVNQPWILKVSVVVTLWRQAQQRCCGGCEEGDFNVHNLLCVSGNEDGGFGCCRRGDICSLTELDCIYPE